MHKKNTSTIEYKWSTFVELLSWRASHQKDIIGYTLLINGEQEGETLTYGELDIKARTIALLLKKYNAAGERVLLLYPTGLDFVAAFFGCLYAGAIAVPAYPPKKKERQNRLSAIVNDANAKIVITNVQNHFKINQWFSELANEGIEILATDKLSDSMAQTWQAPSINSDSLAFLQYTSGSTSDPKGVMISHKNLLYNSELICRCFDHSPETVGLNWLPLYHDMGLIGGMLQPLYAGFHIYFMSPESFIQSPFRWLNAISKYRVNTTGGPNFAYNLCAKKIKPEQLNNMDLSSWNLAFNGAEPINHETLENFSEKFSSFGFNKNAFYTCYGMAEATLIASGGSKVDLPIIEFFETNALENNHAINKGLKTSSNNYRPIVGCGKNLLGQQMIIVDPLTLKPCEQEHIGEIWLAGPSIAQGYWNNLENTSLVFENSIPGFGSEKYLRTGDLGFFYNNELFITGRLKDLIIIRGRNHYPNDIELTVNKCHSALAAVGGAAFSITINNTEQLIIVHEVEKQFISAPINEIATAIRENVALHHELQVYDVVLLMPGRLLRTSSGKVRRRDCKNSYLTKTLESLGNSLLSKALAHKPKRNENTQEKLTRDFLLNAPYENRVELLEEELKTKISYILGIEPQQIDLRNSPVSIGLDSIQTIELQYYFESIFGISIPMSDWLDSSDLYQIIDKMIEKLNAKTLLKNTELHNNLKDQNSKKLSYGQRALWFLYQLSPQSSAYNIAQAFRIYNALDVNALTRALQKIVDRHPALRMLFIPSSSGPFTKILENYEVLLNCIDVSDWSESAIHIHLSDNVHLPFDLEHGSLFRFLLFKRSSREFIFLVVMHHIITDFWSLAILLDELGLIYTAEKNRENIILPNLDFQYSDFVCWQHDMIFDENGERQWNYWKNQLSEPLPVLNLPIDKLRPQIQTYNGNSRSLKLNQKLTQTLKELSVANNTTLSMTLLAAFQVLLHRLTGQDDILIGSPITGRSEFSFRKTVGYFVNTLVLRARFEGNPTFLSFLNQVRITALEAYNNQDFPLSLLIERLQPKRDPGRSPLFQAMYIYQKAQVLDKEGLSAFALGNIEAKLELGEISLETIPMLQKSAQVEITLSAAEISENLVMVLQYNNDLFNANTIDRWLQHFEVLLTEISINPQRPVCNIPVFTPNEINILVSQSNSTQLEFQYQKSIHQLFEEQVLKTPDNIAIVFQNNSLPYNILNQKSNQLAHYLIKLGLSKENFVAIYMERSIELMIGLLGILKAGGTYVPLDPYYPTERLEYMLSDSKANLIITHSKLDNQLTQKKIKTVYIDTDWKDISEENDHNPNYDLVSDSLAYIIYTSGSTGRPKGVQIAHRAVQNFINSMILQPGIDENDILLSVTSLSFDIAVLELFLPLSVGAKLVIATRENTMNGVELGHLITDAGTTLMQATPSTWRLLLESGWPGNKKLRALCGGEACPRELANQLIEHCSIVWNMYGPTETTVWSCISPMKTGSTALPIGIPIANTQIYILDKFLQPLPIGVPGELYIGGEGLARGYLNLPEFTAEKFIPNPFSTEPGKRLYKTGDLVRYRFDGELEFLGRLDYQTKIRGFRIELTEIETIILQHKDIQETVVVAHEFAKDDKRLIAYYICRNQTAAINEELRKSLQDKLPDYMIPSVFIMLDAMPLTPNGKINRKALPLPDTNRPEIKTNFIAPQNELEETIAQIWQEVLKLDNVGVHDNFFDLGGHSMLMTKVNNRLNEKLKIELSLVDLFQYSTINTLAAYIAKGSNKTIELLGRRITKNHRNVNRENAKNNSIAIIGIAGRFPGADNIATFWKNLCEGVESIKIFTDNELIDAGIAESLIKNPNYVKASGIIENIELFDANFFGYSPKEAELLDPQQRLFLEVAWQALEDAGYNPDRYQGAIGVYAGTGMNTYIHNNISHSFDTSQNGIGYDIMIGNDKDFLSTRISYKLNLKGPGITVQTACSTSLVATHLACQSLLNEECDIAIAGGVSLRVPQQVGYLYQEGMILSPDGHCRAFDAQAQGTVIGNGSGAVVLKLLSHALADGDQIYSVIKGSAINNDGAIKAGYTAPGLNAQATVIAEAQAKSGVKAETISYIETHGTGTPVGDPIEIAALTKAFQNSTSLQGFCAIGSVKTNIGHLDTASGIAGLIKTSLALKYKKIPPSLNYSGPNPRIDFSSSPFFVNTELLPWTKFTDFRRAGVSSFGIGGTNTHVILEEAPEQGASSPSRSWQLITLSAQTKTALDSIASRLIIHLKENGHVKINELAYTLHVGRKEFEHRRIALCQSIPDALGTMQSPEFTKLNSRTVDKTERPVAFMFSGQGTQYINMASGLYLTEPTFKKNVDNCAELLKPLLGSDLRDILYPSVDYAETATMELQNTIFTQPALFTIEYSLAKLWMEWGVQPDVMIGHSIGEYVAACLSGVFSIEDALELVSIRGKLMQQLPEGYMISISLPEQDILRYLNDDISLAAINAPTLCFVSGHKTAIENLEKQLKHANVSYQRLHTSHAFHSVMMEPMLNAFSEHVRKINFHEPKIPYISNVTGRWISNTEIADPDYWIKHLRQTVRFSEGINELLKEQNRIILEVGPGRSLCSIVQQHSSMSEKHIVIASIRNLHDKRSDDQFILSTLGELWLSGVNIDWDSFHKHEKSFRISLPTYPFERKRYWVDSDKTILNQNTKEKIKTQKNDLAEWFYVPSWKRSTASPYRANIDGNQHSWLIFINEDEIGYELYNSLFNKNQYIVTVKQGIAFERVDNNNYILNPKKNSDYDLLLKELINQKLPTQIIHLWNVNSENSTKDRFKKYDDSQYNGFYSLLFLAQAIGRQNITTSIQITTVTNGMQNVLGEKVDFPEKATLLGPVKIIPYEYFNIICRNIDIETNSNAYPHVVDLLLTEAISSPKETIVAIRGKHRWVQIFEPVRLDNIENLTSRIRENGVYFITGGLGAIGLALANYLAKTVKAKLVLIGRSIFPPENERDNWIISHPENDTISQTIRILKEIESYGAEVLVISADSADPDMMQVALQQSISQFGKIHGVIHAAGLPGGGLVQNKAIVEAERIMEPKVKGTMVLESLFSGQELDFFVVCSSINTIVGRMGQVDYCAANAFLEAFQSSSSLPVICINWDSWSDVGMVAKALQKFSGISKISHPLLDSKIENGVGKVIYTSKIAVNTHWILNEHGVLGKPTLPGTGYLEMAYAAFTDYTGSKVIEIYETFFLAPLILEDNQTKELRIILIFKDQNCNFIIQSRNNDKINDWQDHAHGYIKELKTISLQKLSLEEIKKRCAVSKVVDPLEKHSIGSFELHKHSISRGLNEIGVPLYVDSLIISDKSSPDASRNMEFGPRWLSLQWIMLGAKEGLAYFELPEPYFSDLNKYKLHPGLLDFATSFLRLFQSEGSYLPLSYKALKVKMPLPGKFYSYARFIGEPAPNGMTLNFNVTILNEQGIEVATIDEFTVVRIDDISKLNTISGKRYDLHEYSISESHKDNTKFLQENIDLWLNVDEGVEVFNRVMSCNLNHVIVSTSDLTERISQSYAHRSALIASPENGTISKTEKKYPRPASANAFVSPRNEIEKKLAKIWEDVLRIEPIGINDNFNELGGDSLLGTQVISRAQKSGLQFSLSQVIENQTLLDLAAVVTLKQAPKGTIPSVQHGNKAPLSFAQQRIWFLDQLEQGNPAYNIFNAVRLTGKLDISALERGFQQIVIRHEILRTCFLEENGQPYQVIADTLPVDIPTTDISSYTPSEIAKLLQDEAMAPFDLTKLPLVRINMLRISETEHILQLTMHHIISDGWSLDILFRELILLGQNKSNEHIQVLKQMPIQYADFAIWQREWLKGNVLQSLTDYWKGKLSNIAPILESITEKSYSSLHSHRGERLQIALSKELSFKLQSFSNNEDATLFMTLLAVFQTLLARYSGQTDITVGTPVANRNHTELENLIGSFVNTLVLRSDLSGNPTFRNLLHRTQKVCLGAYEHQDIPFEKLVNELHEARDLGRNPLFQVMFVFQNTPMNIPETARLRIEPMEINPNIVQFDLNLTLWQTSEGIRGYFEYSTDLFDFATIERLRNHFQNLSVNLIESPDQPIFETSILSPDERNQLLVEWNQIKPDCLNDKCIHELFEDKVIKSHDSIALVFNEQTITYNELNRRANKLAHYLRTKGVRPDDIVGILVERSIDMIVSILGILKAGGAYLPLDPAYPKERINYILNDSNPAILLTQKNLFESSAYDVYNITVFYLDTEWDSLINFSCENLENKTLPENLAYVIYTSGSTGKPKGSLLQHNNVTRLFLSTETLFDFNENDIWTLFHSYAFDFSVWEIWGALTYGGKLVIVPYLVSRTPNQFHELLKQEKVTILNQTPSAFNQLIDVDIKESSLTELNLRYVIFGGEALKPKFLSPWLQRHGYNRPRLINMYGITETTVHVTYFELDENTKNNSCVGRQIPDLKIYILDSYLNPVPIGVRGEIFVAGDGLARGYLNRPELTTEKFIPNPFSQIPGERMYKTGDQARYLNNGNIEYIGRTDNQVKIRGFRIELGEIEISLSVLPEIREVVVIAQEDIPGNKQLIAYLVANEGHHIPETTVLRSLLSEVLPDYMIPAHFIILQNMPLTENGKIDRNALPAPDNIRKLLGYIAPRNSTEENLARIWSEVLKIDKVGINDNFFDLGGDSIRTVSIVSKAKEYGLLLTLENIFRYQTIAGLSEQLALTINKTMVSDSEVRISLISDKDKALLLDDIEDAYVVSNMQLGMIYHNQLTPDLGTYHDVFSYKLNIPKWDLAIFDNVLQALMQKHQILRTSFNLNDFSEPLQLVHKKSKIPLIEFNISMFEEKEQDKIIEEWIDNEKITTFDLGIAPLMRIFIHLLSNDTLMYTLSFHHAIIDGWSVASFQTELFGEYLKLITTKGYVLDLKPLSSSFKQSIEIEIEALHSIETKEFWEKFLDGNTASTLPVFEPCEHEYKENKLQLSIHDELRNKLILLANNLHIPLRTVLLTAHLRVLSMLSGKFDVTTGLTIHNRPETQDGEKVLGLFINALPFRKILNHGSWKSLIFSIFETELSVIPHRAYPYAKLLSDNGRVPLSEIVFNYINFHVYDSIRNIGSIKLLSESYFEATNFALFLNVCNHGEHLQIDFLFDPTRLSSKQVKNISDYYLSILESMVADPDASHDAQNFITKQSV